jgi:acetyltransferase-like isoleucine patch superfamily enzyme
MFMFINVFEKIFSILSKIIDKLIIQSSINKYILAGNSIVYYDAKLSNVKFDSIGSNNNIVIKEGCIFNNFTFFIRGNNHKILIEKNCRFNRGGVIWIEDDDCSLSIGEGSSFEDVHIAITEPGSKLSIGKDCMFANFVDVRTGDSHSIISQETQERINFAKDVFIGDHVWVAAHSIILKGSSIPENSIVATGSIVTKRYIQKGIILAGNPASTIKEGINWSRNRIYENDKISGN